MSVNGTTQLANLIPEMWSPMMFAELRNNLMMAEFFEKSYEGVISQMGDIVRVNQVVAPNGEILTDDTQAFNSESLTINQKSLTVNKRASAAIEISDLARLQSQSFEVEVQNALVYAVTKKIEQDIIDALIPSASAPDHQIAPASASDLAAADIAGARKLLRVAKVPTVGMGAFLDPAYYADILTKTQLVSKDFQSGSPTENGNMGNLFGFKVGEHDLLSADVGFFAHPSALQVVMQQGLRIKVSDLHANKKYGYVISADIVYGISLFDNTRIVKISG